MSIVVDNIACLSPPPMRGFLCVQPYAYLQVHTYYKFHEKIFPIGQKNFNLRVIQKSTHTMNSRNFLLLESQQGVVAIRPRYPISLWNQYKIAINKVHRTNNVWEGWHNRLQLVGKHHPDIYTAVGEIQKEEG